MAAREDCLSLGIAVVWETWLLRATVRSSSCLLLFSCSPLHTHAHMHTHRHTVQVAALSKLSFVNSL